MAGIFPPANRGGILSPNVCNGFSPTHSVIGEGPLYVSPECATLLTDCQMNAIVSELLAAVDHLGYPFNANLIDNLGRALTDRFNLQQAQIDMRVNRAGDTMLGPLELSECPPANDNDAACKSYVDQTALAAAAACCDHMAGELTDAVTNIQTQLDDRVRRNGDQMTGALILSPADSGNALQAGSIGQIFLGPAPPVGAPPDRLWWDSTSGKLFVRYADSSSVQWVEVIT